MRPQFGTWSKLKILRFSPNIQIDDSLKGEKCTNMRELNLLISKAFSGAEA